MDEHPQIRILARAARSVIESSNHWRPLLLWQMWILAAENLYIGWKPNWMKRPDAAVSLFIALSGFCAHWAYADKMSTSVQKALGATFPFWLGRFMKTAFLYYLALVICIVLKNPNQKPPLFPDGYQRYEVPMNTTDYLLAVVPSLTVVHPWTPWRPSNKDDVVNGPSWTVSRTPCIGCSCCLLAVAHQDLSNAPFRGLRLTGDDADLDLVRISARRCCDNAAARCQHRDGCVPRCVPAPIYIRPALGPQVCVARASSASRPRVRCDARHAVACFCRLVPLQLKLPPSSPWHARPAVYDSQRAA